MLSDLSGSEMRDRLGQYFKVEIVAGNLKAPVFRLFSHHHL
jgi:hypothetical protein